MSSTGYRITQRRPQACQECTKRKRKCDKRSPCGRCRSLKIECTKETVRLRSSSTKHADEIAFLESLYDDVATSYGADCDIVRKIADRVSYLRFGNSGPPRTTPDEPTTSQPDSDEVITASSLVTDPKEDEANVLTALEYMAWGRSFGGCYPHVRCTCQHNRTSRTTTDDSRTRSLDRIGLHLPKAEDARRLVQFHIRHLAWHHNCLHCPTFLEQCETFWRNGSYDHPLWLAMYISVLSATVCSVQNTNRFSKELGVDVVYLSASRLFRDMLDVLYTEDFLGDVTLYSIQAIVISTEVAHNIGFSQLNAILFGAAIRLAQCLGLHKISSSSPATTESQSGGSELLDLELGKRIWCQMVIQDLFAIPFNDSYGINPRHYSTELPTNCDDDLVPKDTGVVTVSSYCRVLAQLALLMPELADGLGPVRTRRSLQQQYNHILRMDQKMRETVHQIHPSLLRELLTEQSTVPWLSIARRSLAITAADKIIMIHRPFLFRSFQSSAYSYTRKTCVAAAMTILREHKAIAQTDELSIWTHTAFCITASVILCFEISCQSRIDNEQITIYRSAVQAARDRLSARKEDVLASRGVMLIDIIFHEEAVVDVENHVSGSSKTIDLPKVVKQFIDANKTVANGDLSSTMWGLYPFDMVDDIGGEFLADIPTLPAIHDFDEWYSNTFNEGQLCNGNLV